MFYLLLSVLLVVFSVYWKWVRPSKSIYDSLTRQGIGHEPFVPLLGQLSEIRRYREAGRLLDYHEMLREKHGLLYLFSLGPYPRLAVHDLDLLGEILGRSQADTYSKPADLGFRLQPLIGLHNLLVSNGLEHERARKMLNPAFHFVNLQSILFFAMGTSPSTCRNISVH